MTLPIFSEKIMNNVLNLENWIVVGEAMLKMFGFFWPIAVFIGIAFIWSAITEPTTKQAQ
jgi:hypothetical protein